MNFRIIALASCIALGSIALGGKAQAQSTTTVGGSGTVAPFCNVTNTPSAGTMTLDSTGKILSSSAAAGSFTLTCNNTATFTVATTANAATAPAVSAGAVYTAELKDGATSLTTSTGTTTSAASSAISTNNFVDRPITMIHTLRDSTNNLPTGSYAFTSIVSITPQ